MTGSRAAAIATALAIWSLLVVQASYAQETEQPVEAPPPEEPKEITSADFAVEASAVEERLARVNAEISAIDASKEVRTSLDAIEADGEQLEAHIEETVTRRTMSSELNTIRLALDTLDTRLKRQIERLGVYSKELEALNEQTGEDLELWTRALRTVQQSSAPSEVKKRVASLVQGLREGRKALGKKLDEQLLLQTRALDVRDAINSYSRAVAAAQREQAAAVFEQQDPPIWEIGKEAGEGERIGYELSLSGSALVDGLRRDGNLVFLELAIFLLVAWLLRRARRRLSERLRKRGDGGSALWETQADEALRHPWAAAALLTLSSVRLVYPDREVELILFTWVIVIPLWFVVFKEMVPRSFRKFLVGLGVLATIQIVATLVADHVEVERALLLLELLLYFVGAGWYVRVLHAANGDERPTRRGFWAGTADVWARVTWFFAGVGVVAAVFGYTYLATEAAMLTTITTIAATAWVALSRIVEALVSTGIHGGSLDAFRMVRANRDVVARNARRVIRILAVFFFAWSVADYTSIWRPAWRWLVGVLSTDLGFGFAELDLTVADLLGFFFVLWLSWRVARLVGFILSEEIFPRLDIKEGLPYALTSFTRYAIIAIGFTVAMSVLGVSLDRMTIMLSAFGVGIGFGLQSVVNNVVSGFILLTERPVRLRDKVEVGDVLGIVTNIGIRASAIRTFDGAEVILPNADLTSKRLINWTLSGRQQRVTIPVGVEYGTDPNRVLTLLRSVAAQNDKVFKSPAPLALFRGFGDSSLDFELRIFMDPSDVLDVPSEVHVAISAALEDAGIRVPFPQRDLHVWRMPDAPTEDASADGGDSGPDSD